MITLNESHSDEIKIVKNGSRKRGFFFGILGLLFQILFLWGYWSFLDESGTWAIFWLTIVNSELFPFTYILFVFGAGCFLVAIREFGWQEVLVIKTNLFETKSGFRKEIRLFRWLHATNILNHQIVTLRLHSILLDQFGIQKSFQIEVDYRESPGSSIKSLTLYKDHEDRINSAAKRLVVKIHEILSLSNEIEKTESSLSGLEGKKREKENISKLN